MIGIGHAEKAFGIYRRAGPGGEGQYRAADGRTDDILVLFRPGARQFRRGQFDGSHGNLLVDGTHFGQRPQAVFRLAQVFARALHLQGPQFVGVVRDDLAGDQGTAAFHLAFRALQLRRTHGHQGFLRLDIGLLRPPADLLQLQLGQGEALFRDNHGSRTRVVSIKDGEDVAAFDPLAFLDPQLGDGAAKGRPADDMHSLHRLYPSPRYDGDGVASLHGGGCGGREGAGILPRQQE